MCETCYKKYGSPETINRKVLKAVKLIETVYTYCCTGGGLHVQLDDWNIDDCYWEDYIIYSFNLGSSNKQIVAEIECFRQMKKMTIKERATALALYDGYIKEPK